MKLGVTLVLGLWAVAAVCEDGYAVIDAIAVPDSRKQPTFIAFQRPNRIEFHHIRVGKSLYRLRPGMYRLHHFDFAKTIESRQGTLYPSVDGIYEFKVEPDVITFVGAFVMHGSGKGGRKYDLTLTTDRRLLGWACAENRELFTRLPVKVQDGTSPAKTIRVVCKD